MTAPHFFAASVEADRISIEGDDAHHAVRVLRIKPGETITISDGAGNVVEAKVVEAASNLVADVSARRREPRPHPSLTVYQGIPKHGKLESIVQDLVEIGVDRIVPLRAARSIPRWDAAKTQARLERWRVVAREAAMQSRRAWLPEIGELASVNEIPLGTLILHEEAIRSLTSSLPDGGEVRIAIGPEGGFDPSEIEAFEDAGLPVVSLGRSVLRTETAPIVASALILARYQRLG